jgi:hypothetical protein
MSQTKARLQFGPLKNGNRRGDLRQVRQCGAKTRQGTSCRSPAMPNGRCRLHGGKSTGPRTPEGLEAMRRAKLKHGLYSQETREFYRLIRELKSRAQSHIKRMLDRG